MDHLKLDQNQISKDGIRIEVTSGDVVVVHWDGQAYMTIDQFRKICDAAS